MLTVPLTFPNASTLRTKEGGRSECVDIVEKGFQEANPTALEYWEGGSDLIPCGIVLGCEDGSLYVFSHVEANQGAPMEPMEQRRRRPRSPVSIPRAHTPTSSTSASFSISLRPRAVSGVTHEKVEAPKNFVDFEEEADKLKDILQGRNPRQSLSEAPSPVPSPAPSIIEPSPQSNKKRKSPPRSLLSPSGSAPPTPRTFSSPGSPLDHGSGWSPSFTLRYHVIPSCAGPGHAVRAIHVLEGNKYVAVLHQQGDLKIYASKDGECVTSVSAASHGGESRPQDVWDWCSLKVGSVDEDTVLFVTAATNSSVSAATPDVDEASAEKSKTVIFKLSVGPSDVHLESLGLCELDGPARGIGLHCTGSHNSSLLYSINNHGHLILRQLSLAETTPSPAIAPSPSSDSDHLAHLALPRSIKAMVSRSSDTVDDGPKAKATLPRLQQGSSKDAGLLLSDSTLSGLATRDADGALYGIVWAHREMTIFSYNAETLHTLYSAQVSHLEDAEWLDNDTYALSFKDRMEIYRLQMVDADNNFVAFPVSRPGAEFHYQPTLVRILPTGPHQAGTFIPSSDLIVTKVDEKGHRMLVAFHVREGKQEPGQISTTLWQPRRLEPLQASEVIQTAVLPLELEDIVQGYSDGQLRQFSLEQMILQNKDDKGSLSPANSSKASQHPLSGSLIGLDVVQNTRTHERFIMGGANDGSIAFWNLNTYELCARWTAFCAPLVRVIDFEHEAAGVLRGCVLCVSADGTIAVVVVDGFQFLYLIPGSFLPLKTLHISGTSLLLIYESKQARVWDLQAKEFHRSMSVDKAKEMLKQGSWVSVTVDPTTSVSRSEWKRIAPAFTGRDAVATLDFSLERFVVEAMALTKTISTSKDEVRNILRTFDRLRLLLSVLLTTGLSPDVDSICTGKLGLPVANVGVGFSSLDATILYPSAQPQEAWCISGNVSAARLVSIVFVLRALSLFEDSAEAANSVIAFYTTSLGACIGPKFAPPSLEYLGRLWFDASTEMRQAIRVVFDATLATLDEQEIIAIAEKWQHYLPSTQDESERENVRTALALFICGFIAADRFNLLSITALVDISKSVALYFHDEQSTHRVLAIDLCSKGFNVWQQYVDTLDILRSLFMLATTTRKASISVQNVGAQARIAVLAIAAQNTPLFMSTLCLDVLDPSSLEHRRSVMQIVAFLIRKRPAILQPHIPKLMEAVVKSLDPNSNSNREAVLGAATEIVGYVVKTYPTVDFHGGTQKLAVGTSEGAVIMYDLKTAIRLYVLEGHRQQLAACSFSPDGRRLVTVSLVDQLVMVWKVGTSFTSFFTPGVPPRQGNGGSEPFKCLPFNLGISGDASPGGDPLKQVEFEWSGDRSVKVKIRDIVLTFST